LKGSNCVFCLLQADHKVLEQVTQLEDRVQDLVQTQTILSRDIKAHLSKFAQPLGKINIETIKPPGIGEPENGGRVSKPELVKPQVSETKRISDNPVTVPSTKVSLVHGFYFCMCLDSINHLHDILGRFRGKISFSGWMS